MTNYESGRRFEWELKKRFEKEGATVVRSAGSKSPIDLVVIWKNRLAWLVQAKIFSGSVPKPSQEFKDLKASMFKKMWIARRKGRHRSQFEYEVD
jgi:hypothetical protein